MLRASALLAVLLVASACASPDDGPDAAGAAASDTLAVRTDSLLIAVDSLRYTVAIGYPQLTGATATVSAETVARINAAIRDSVTAAAESFRPEAAVAAEDRDSPMSATEVAGGTDVALLPGDLLSGLVEVYAFTGGAHGNTFYMPFTYDLRAGTAVALGDVFRGGTPWADSLSAHADRALVAKARDTDDPVSVDEARATLTPEGYTPEAMQRATFSLGADSLMVHFAPYEVAYYAFGSTSVPVAYADLAPMLRPDGAAARLTARP